MELTKGKIWKLVMYVASETSNWNCYM